ncbi:unnamed protein product [Tilletia controversa]|nr:unnamed protein product [Tilletia controversa]
MAHHNLHLHIPQGNGGPMHQAFSPNTMSPSAGPQSAGGPNSAGPQRRFGGPGGGGGAGNFGPGGNLGPGMRQLQHIQSQLHASQQGHGHPQQGSPAGFQQPGGRRPGAPTRLGLNAMSAPFMPGGAGGAPAPMLSPGFVNAAGALSPGSGMHTPGAPNMAGIATGPGPGMIHAPGNGGMMAPIPPGMGMGMGIAGIPMSLSPSALTSAGLGPPTPLSGMNAFPGGGGHNGAGGPPSGASTPSIAASSAPQGRMGGISPIPGAGGPGGGMSASASSNNLMGRGQAGRKSRGLPQHTPLKTTGHNSKPSVSMSGPAVFQLLSSVQGAALKKRNVVALPKEIDDAAHEEAVANLAALQQDADQSANGTMTEQDKSARKARNAARDAAAVRSKWPAREPEPFDPELLQPDAHPDLILSDEQTVSAAMYPEAWPYDQGLPESIDIYLPGKGAWDIYREQRIRERIEAAEVEDRSYDALQQQLDGVASSQFDSRSASRTGYRGAMPPTGGAEVGETSWGYGVGAGDSSTFGIVNHENNDNDGHAADDPSHAHALSISSPADHNMVSFKLNRYLQSQADADNPHHESNNTGPGGRRLSSYSDSADNRYETAVPQSGTHAPSASLAIAPTQYLENFLNASPAQNALARSASDRGTTMGFDGLGRPEMVAQRGGMVMAERVSSSYGRLDSGVHTAPGDISASLEELDATADTTAASSAAANKGDRSGTPNWKDLARGFGYDLAEVDEEGDEEVRSGPHSRKTSKSHRNGVARPGDNDDDGGDNDDDDDDADMRTNPSEDADDSNVEDEDEDDGEDESRTHRRQTSQASERHWARRSTAQLSDFGTRPPATTTAAGHARASMRGSNEISGLSLSELELHNHNRRHEHGEGELEMEEEDAISEATTEGASEEVYSNPSDEEAAQLRREERREMRERRRASRGGMGSYHSPGAQRNARGGNGGGGLGRPRSGTVNTLPSSSFGEGDDYDQRRNPRARPPGFPGASMGRRPSDRYEIVSNPSDEDGDQFSGGAETFGGHGPLDHPLSGGPSGGHVGRMSEDFRFPPSVGAYGVGGRSNEISPYQTQAYHESGNNVMPRFGTGAGTIGNNSSGTIGRSAGNSMLNPAAKEFSFGDISGTSSRPSLNAAAPSFTPGKFTFTAPGVAKVTIPEPIPLVYPARALPSQEVALEKSASGVRDAQGREKRPRFGRNAEMLLLDEGEFLFQQSEDAFDPTTHFTPQQRPMNSTASIEGPLRNLQDGTSVRPFGSLDSIHAPARAGAGAVPAAPSLPNIIQHHRPSASGDYSLQANAQPFQPTWGRSTAAGPASRPGIPSFAGMPAAAERPMPLIFGSSGVLSTVPASDFTFTIGNKAIPIRRPDEAGIGGAADISNGSHSHEASIHADGSRTSMPDVPRDMDSEHDQENDRRGSLAHRPSIGDVRRISETSTSARVPLSSMYDQYSDDATAAASALVSASAVHAAKQKLARSAPVPIPMLRPDQAAQQAAGHASSTGLARSFRSHGRNGTAESLAHSLTSGRAMRHRRASTVEVDSLGEGDEGRSGDDDVDEDEDDEDAVSDIIEELGERIEKALDGWAGKILDEVTIMGQVRPMIGAKLDAADRDALLESFGVRVEEQLQDHFARFKETTAAQTAAAAAAAAAKAEMDATKDTDSTVMPTRTAHPSRTGSGHPPLDAVGELDFDYVSDTLDQKIADLKRELMAAFDTALPRAMESVVDKIPAPAPVAAPAPATITASNAASATFPSTMDLSLSSSQELADLLLRRLQSALEAKQDSTNEVLQNTLEKVLEPLLEDGFARAQVKSVVDRTESAHQLTELMVSKFGDLENLMGESRQTIEDHLQVALINGLVPHIETLRQEPIDPDLVAARVLEILVPMLDRGYERESSSRKNSEEGRPQPVVQTDDIADTTVERLLPFLNALKPAHIDIEELGAMLDVSLAKKHISAETDLEPVIALLEPLVSNQADARTMSRQTIDRLKEVESTLSVLPGAINAKTEIFLTATQQTHDTQGSILERINDLGHQLQTMLHRTAELDEQRDELIRQLDEVRKEVNERKAEADEAKSELSAANGYGNTLKDELTRLEARLDQAERAAEEVTDQMDELRTRAQQAREREHIAERRADQMTAQAREAQHAGDAAQAQNLLLQKRLEELSSELAEARAERNRQREAATQSTADAIVRAERAEMAADEARQRADARVDEAARVERNAHEQASAIAERAAKAEGEAASLEKRVIEQDSKIANLQQLTATQKQKAAQSQQKLSESDKKMQHFEQQAQDLAIANARLAEMEARLADKEAVEDRLAHSQDAEMRLREELSTYHTRFLDLEKDLITMKESMVGRDELEAVQAELAGSREDVARLNGQLAEREQQAAAALAAAKELQQHQQQQQQPLWDGSHAQHPGNVNTWTSIQAPPKRQGDFHNDGAHQYPREMPTPTTAAPRHTYASNGANNWGDSDSSTDSFAPTGQSGYSSYAQIAPPSKKAPSFSGRSESFGPTRVPQRDAGGWWS